MIPKCLNYQDCSAIYAKNNKEKHEQTEKETSGRNIYVTFNIKNSSSSRSKDPNLFRLCRAEYAFAIWKPLDLDRSHVGSKYKNYLQFLAPFQTASKCGNLTRS